MSKVSLVTISEDANLFGGESTAQSVHFETKRKTEIKYFSEENNLSEQMKDEAACPDSSFHSSRAEMQNEIEGCEDFDDNGVPSGSHCECPGSSKEQESTATADDRPPTTTKTSQLNLTEQRKKQNCKKKSKKPRAGSDVAAGQDISKGKPTAAATGADAVPETPIPTGDAATTAASTISLNKGKPLSPFSFHTMMILSIVTVFGHMQGNIINIL